MTSEDTKIDFGDYVQIEQKRYGVPNEMYCYKVIGGGLSSNEYVNVPVQAPETEEIHSEVEPVIRCVCMGLVEDKISKFRVKDVKLTTK